MLPRHLSLRTSFALLIAVATILPFVTAQSTRTARKLSYGNGETITLSLPPEFDINVAASGLHRVRFFAKSPDGRIFATDMYNRTDNTHGSVFILEGWNEQTHTFNHVVHYLDHLRNPNNLAFYTEPAAYGRPAQTWLYLPLTDRLLRYKYSAGDDAPTSEPEVLAHYPDYGLNYKYGGWHLTRTVAFATFGGKTKLFVSVGSSCDACQEKEPVRASLQMMDPDGKHHGTVAKGLRNAVGLAYFPALDGGSLFATNMGDDHLGDDDPEDTFFELDSNNHPGPIDYAARFDFTNWLEQPIQGHPGAFRGGNEFTPMPADYGWPTCYFSHGTAKADTLISAPKPTDRIFPPPPAGPPPPQIDCSKVPSAYTTFAAHSSPLGLEYFAADNPVLHDSFLVALHGAGHARIGTGYRVVRFSPKDPAPHDFLTGFLTFEQGKPVIHGRPCGLLRVGPDSFLLTDDYLGLVYFIHSRV